MKHYLLRITPFLATIFIAAHGVHAGYSLIDEGVVVSDGLYLSSTAFGRQITPKVDGLQVYDGYIFVSDYKGGMDQRDLRLHRKPIGGGEWKTITFPHKHVGYQADSNLPFEDRRGDSHNYVAIGISPKNDTIHLLYDMHSYTPGQFPDDYFNYSVSVRNAATVPDSQWDLNLFNPKQNHLNPSLPASTYYDITYPVFHTTPGDDLIVDWRQGGSQNATKELTKFDGRTWSNSTPWNNTTGSDTTGIYGQYQIVNDRMYKVWARRKSSDQTAGYINQRGLYLAYSENADGSGPWYTADGQQHGLPITDLDAFKIAEPTVPGEKGGGPYFAITDSGAFHAIMPVDNRYKHYYQASLAAPLKVAEPYDAGHVNHGNLFAIGDRVYLAGIENQIPVIKSTAAGESQWRYELQAADGIEYVHGVVSKFDASFYFSLMEDDDTFADSKPIRVLRTEIASGGETYYLRQDLTSSTHLLEPERWFADPTLGGATIADGTANFVGSQFVLNSFDVTTPGTSGYQGFGGTIVVDQPGSSFRQRSGSLTINELVVSESAGGFDGRSERDDQKTRINRLELNSEMTFREPGTALNARASDLRIDELDGSGTLRFGANTVDIDNLWGFTATDEEGNFDGEIYLRRGTLEFGTEVDLSSATFFFLDRDNESKVLLSNDATFAAVEERDYDNLNAVTMSIDPGTYSATELDALLGTSGRFLGSGTLTVLGISTSLPGDFDGSGAVDGSDFLLWQRGGSPLPYSADDLFDWQANFSIFNPSAARAVPEPSTAMLLAMWVMSLSGCWSRRDGSVADS